MGRPVILIELNEVPPEILDDYATRSSFMRDFLDRSDRYRTIAADRLQLDPWIAWPSLHRGVNDEVHRLLHLGQSTSGASSFPPIWRILADAGHRVGVYGSLFSSSETEYSDYSFYVPDVFSPHSNVKPTSLQAFQKFNLHMTRASARNVDGNVESGGPRVLLDLAARRRFRPGTLARVASQLASERINRDRVSRRRNTQTELHGDIFHSLLRQTPTHFATFYTNNVAAAMHRFWSAARAEGSANRDKLSSEWINKYSHEVDSALFSIERLIKHLVETCPWATIVVASAIGQEEIPAENHSSFVTITDPGRFVSSLVDDVAVTHAPTMVPDFTFHFQSEVEADKATQRISTIALDGLRPVETPTRMHSREIASSPGGHAFLRHDYSKGDFKHPFTFSRSGSATLHVSLQIDDHQGRGHVSFEGETRSMNSLGLGVLPHDEGVNCTAQHSALGSLVVYRGLGSSNTSVEHAWSTTISAMDVAPSLLNHFELPTPPYMSGSPTVEFA